MRHRNPHEVADPDDIFDVFENSSHPELYEHTRIYCFKGRTFTKLEHLEQHLKDEGVNVKSLYYRAGWEPDDYKGGVINRVTLCERIPSDELHDRHKFKDFDQELNRTKQVMKQRSRGSGRSA